MINQGLESDNNFSPFWDVGRADNKKTCRAENLTLCRFLLLTTNAWNQPIRFDIKVATVQKMVCVSAVCRYFWRF